MELPPVEFHVDALAEADEAFLRYQAADPRVAERFRTAIRGAARLIAEGPQRYPQYSRRTRFIKLHKFPYLLVYETFDDKIHIVAVAHGRRRPHYWRRRLKKRDR
jgi:plasmid stabilization system protein ParE